MLQPWPALTIVWSQEAARRASFQTNKARGSATVTVVASPRPMAGSGARVSPTVLTSSASPDPLCANQTSVTCSSVASVASVASVRACLGSQCMSFLPVQRDARQPLHASIARVGLRCSWPAMICSGSSPSATQLAARQAWDTRLAILSGRCAVSLALAGGGRVGPPCDSPKHV